MANKDKNWKNKAKRERDFDDSVFAFGTPVAAFCIPGARFTHKGTKFEVKKVEECPSMWRTHVHINGSNCFDTRALVYPN